MFRQHVRQKVICVGRDLTSDDISCNRQGTPKSLFCAPLAFLWMPEKLCIREVGHTPLCLGLQGTRQHCSGWICPLEYTDVSLSSFTLPRFPLNQELNVDLHNKLRRNLRRTGNVSGPLKATLLHWGQHNSQGCREDGWGQKQRICAATSSEGRGRARGGPFIPAQTTIVHSEIAGRCRSSLQSQIYNRTPRSTGTEANLRVWAQACTPFFTSCSCSRVTNSSIKPVMFPSCCFITWAQC